MDFQETVVSFEKDEFISLFDELSFECEYRNDNMCMGYNEEGRFLVVVCNPKNCLLEIELEKVHKGLVGNA